MISVTGDVSRVWETTSRRHIEKVQRNSTDSETSEQRPEWETHRNGTGSRTTQSVSTHSNKSYWSVFTLFLTTILQM